MQVVQFLKKYHLVWEEGGWAGLRPVEFTEKEVAELVMAVNPNSLLSILRWLVENNRRCAKQAQRIYQILELLMNLCMH